MRCGWSVADQGKKEREVGGTIYAYDAQRQRNREGSSFNLPHPFHRLGGKGKGKRDGARSGVFHLYAKHMFGRKKEGSYGQQSSIAILSGRRSGGCEGKGGEKKRKDTGTPIISYQLLAVTGSKGGKKKGKGGRKRKPRCGQFLFNRLDSRRRKGKGEEKKVAASMFPFKEGGRKRWRRERAGDPSPLSLIREEKGKEEKRKCQYWRTPSPT